jgi:hypothetical protein
VVVKPFQGYLFVVEPPTSNSPAIIGIRIGSLAKKYRLSETDGMSSYATPLLSGLKQCVQRKRVWTIVAKVVRNNAVYQIEFTPSLFIAHYARTLKIAHDRWIAMVVILRIHSERNEQFLKKVGGAWPPFSERSQLALIDLQVRSNSCDVISAAIH